MPQDGVAPYTPPADGDKSGGIQISDEQIAAMAEKSGDSVEHIREMLNLAEKGTEGVKQEKLAGKYSSDEALNQGIQNITTKLEIPKEKADKLVEAMGAEEAYKYWQSQLGKKGADDSAGKKDESGSDGQVDALSGEDGKDGKGEGDGDSSQNSSFDIEKYSKEYDEAGQLSEASYEELAKQGIPKPMVDAYIAGLEAQGRLYNQAVHEVAGGEKAYDAMVDWASNNLTQAEKNRFNTALESGDVETVRPMIEALRARYERAEGTFQRQKVEGSEGRDGTNVSGYESVEQMRADMKDPRYKAGDKAYHAYVQQRIKNSKVL